LKIFSSKENQILILLRANVSIRITVTENLEDFLEFKDVLGIIYKSGGRIVMSCK